MTRWAVPDRNWNAMVGISLPSLNPFGKFDYGTALITLAVAPLFYYIIRRVVRFVKPMLASSLDALFWAFGKRFMRSLHTRLSLQRYCRNRLDHPFSRYLQVPGKEMIALETDNIYVPLKLDDGAYTSDLDGRYSVFEKGSRIRIVGDPGSGKTSIVKSLYRDACRLAMYRYQDHRLPILLELKRFVPPEDATDEELTVWGLEQLRSEVSTIEGFDMAQLFDAYVEHQGLVVFLDGLDEVSSSAYNSVARTVNLLARRLSKMSFRNAICVTMREQFHRQVSANFDDDFPLVYHIRPFSPADVYIFLTLWPFTGNRSEKITRIYAELTDRPTLREMCSNPLVLAMYVANDQRNEEGAPPDTRTAFYSQVVEELLVVRRARQVGLQARTALREQREAILGRIAYENLTDAERPANLISWQLAVDTAREVLKCGSDGDAEDALRALASQTGLITEERVGESVRFIHLTFCEFFAAKECTQGRKNGWAELVGLHRRFTSSRTPQLRTRLVEVIPFALALLPRSQRADGMQDVWELSDSALVGRCFLETQEYSHPVWPRFSQRESRQLVGDTSSGWDQRWLRRLHLFNVILGDQETWARAYGVAPTLTLDTLFRDLIRSDPTRLSKVFTSFAILDAAASFRLTEAMGVDLVREFPRLIVENLDSPPFFDIAMEQFRRSPQRVEDWASVLAIAGLKDRQSALKLEAMAPFPELHKLALSKRRSRWWFFKASAVRAESYTPLLAMTDLLTRPSLYSCCLTVAAASTNQDFGDLDAGGLRAIRTIRGPGSCLSSKWIRLLAMALLGGVVTLLWPKIQSRGAIETWLVAVLIGSTWLAWVLLAYPIVRYRLYVSIAADVPARIKFGILGNPLLSPAWFIARGVLRRPSLVAQRLVRTGSIPPYLYIRTGRDLHELKPTNDLRYEDIAEVESDQDSRAKYITRLRAMLIAAVHGVPRPPPQSVQAPTDDDAGVDVRFLRMTRRVR